MVYHLHEKHSASCSVPCSCLTFCACLMFCPCLMPMSSIECPCLMSIPLVFNMLSRILFMFLLVSRATGPRSSCLHYLLHLRHTGGPLIAGLSFPREPDLPVLIFLQPYSLILFISLTLQTLATFLLLLVELLSSEFPMSIHRRRLPWLLP